jgi:alpha-mannosidase
MNKITGGLLRPISAWILLGLCVGLNAQTMKAPDITKVPTLYVIPYAHLDTQWNWEFPQTISEFLLKTMRVNFDYIDKYPHYVFNWTGANRYRLMKEYYPADYARMKGYIAAGRWFPAGSSVEEGDVNLPSAEGIFRQILYGNTYFRDEFGKASEEYMLPDCFGFPASLPSILAHAGIKGFSTQKLTWGSALVAGGPDSIEQTPDAIPFNVGLWVGPDGKSVIAALNPGVYGSNVSTDLSKAPSVVLEPQLSDAEKAKLTPQQLRAMERPRQVEQDWVKRINLDGAVTGVFADYHYVGTGDIGGATRESTVKLLEAIVTKSETVLPSAQHSFGGQAPDAAATAQKVRVGEGPVHVVESTGEQMFEDITPAMTTRMPKYSGDIELINHTPGALTSQAYHKRWVLKNEVLADAAEKSSIAAAWLGARVYPQRQLNDAWMLALGAHFHDTASGTASPRAYEFAWNDDVIVANEFAGVLNDATRAVASGLDTQAKGMPLVVFNPLNIAREDVVEASVPFAHGLPKAVRVLNPEGIEVPSQVEAGKVLFLAKVPSVSYSVFDVSAATGPEQKSTLKVTESMLENSRYRVQLDKNGDVASIYDKSIQKELLAGPIRLAISTDRPKVNPSWNMEFDQEQAAPRSYVAGTARIRVVENGPVRVAIEVTRMAEDSKFVQTVSLSAGGAGDRVEFSNVIDWRTASANLKVSFPLAAQNEDATYNWDVGTIKRPTAWERQFEVVSHRWIDLTDKSGSFGATVLSGDKIASDKPNGNTLRLTLMRTPGLQPTVNGREQSYSDQANQDWGHHEFVFGLAGHAGDWRQTGTDWQAYRLSSPLLAFSTAAHAGGGGKKLSLVSLSNARVRVLAMKKAENSDEVVLRMVELDGRAAPDVRVTFATPVVAAREIDAQERPLGTANVSDGSLVTSFTANQPRSFALRLGTMPKQLQRVLSHPVTLAYDLSAASDDDTPTAGGGFDGNGNALPAEMLPAQMTYHGVEFKLAPAKTGVPDAVIARGQTIDLPAGHYNRLYFLAASTGGDQTATFRAGKTSASLVIQDWSGFIGQWDTRVWKNQPERDWAISANNAPWPPSDMAARERYSRPRYPEDYVRLDPGYIKPADLAWYASHHHTASGLNQPYAYSYLFAYSIDLPQDAKTLTLPNNDKIRILAISAVEDEPHVQPAQPLFDTLGRVEVPSQLSQAIR